MSGAIDASKGVAVGHHPHSSHDPDTPKITLGVELEFLVPDTDPEEPNTPGIDHHPEDNRWFLCPKTEELINDLRPANDFFPYEYVQYWIKCVLRITARLPCLFHSHSEDDSNVRKFIGTRPKHWPPRPSPPREAITHARQLIWQTTTDSTVFMPTDHPFSTMYGWHGIELISPVFASLPALRADVDEVCTSLRSKVRTTVNKTTGLHVHAAALNMVDGEAQQMTKAQIKRAITLFCLWEGTLFELVAPWRRNGRWLESPGEGSGWCRRVFGNSAFSADAFKELEAAKRSVVEADMSSDGGHGSETSCAETAPDGISQSSQGEDDTASSVHTLGRDESLTTGGNLPDVDNPYEETPEKDETLEANIPDCVLDPRGHASYFLKKVWTVPSRRGLRNGLLLKGAEAVMSSSESTRLALNLSRHPSNVKGGEAGWTLEFRMMHGTLDPELIGRWAEVCQAFMRIAALEASEFKAFLESTHGVLMNPETVAEDLLQLLGLDEKALEFWRRQKERYEDPHYGDEGTSFLPPVGSQTPSSTRDLSRETTVTADSEPAQSEKEKDEAHDDSGFFDATKEEEANVQMPPR